MIAAVALAGDKALELEWPPTSENIAAFIYDGVLRLGINAASVSVSENATCMATFQPHGG